MRRFSAVTTKVTFAENNNAEECVLENPYVNADTVSNKEVGVAIENGLSTDNDADDHKEIQEFAEDVLVVRV